MLSINVVPVWDDHGKVHTCGVDEVREDLADSVIGWSCLATIELYGEQYLLLLTVGAE